MSAFIVSKNHILFLIAASLTRSINDYGCSWYHDNKRHTLESSDSTRAAEVANMLWRENIKSVSHLYPGESSATLPGPVDKSGFTITEADVELCFDRIDPVQVIKSCDCYEYQTCEHDGWESSEACAFITALRRSACSSLPGYDAAEWGAPEIAEGTICLSTLVRRNRKAA